MSRSKKAMMKILLCVGALLVCLPCQGWPWSRDNQRQVRDELLRQADAIAASASQLLLHPGHREGLRQLVDLKCAYVRFAAANAREARRAMEDDGVERRLERTEKLLERVFRSVDRGQLVDELQRAGYYDFDDFEDLDDDCLDDLEPRHRDKYLHHPKWQRAQPPAPPAVQPGRPAPPPARPGQGPGPGPGQPRR